MTASSAEELIEQLVDGARYGDMEDVRGALDAGADVNGKDESSRTGITLAKLLAADFRSWPPISHFAALDD
jgi:hypothetical protein